MNRNFYRPFSPTVNLLPHRCIVKRYFIGSAEGPYGTWKIWVDAMNGMATRHHVYRTVYRTTASPSAAIITG